MKDEDEVVSVIEEIEDPAPPGEEGSAPPVPRAKAVVEAPDANEPPAPEESVTDLQGFWELAQRYADLGTINAIMGEGWGEAVPPPAWSFGDTPEMADELLGLVLEGKKTATSSLRRDYERANEPLPKPGELSIILDSEGIPRVLVRDTQVLVLPFHSVTEEQAAAEGEGDLTLTYWREGHIAFWKKAGVTIDRDTQVVYEQFEVLYPKM
ncbi:MAG: ASCH domain-containing protein [Propionibacteriaceae bacterium]|jgi:uncharacterized protein YhfF|nr:ASCH domain-containing protein [Propionibacteriaceae bacterium]